MGQAQPGAGKGGTWDGPSLCRRRDPHWCGLTRGLSEVLPCVPGRGCLCVGSGASVVLAARGGYSSTPLVFSSLLLPRKPALK